MNKLFVDWHRETSVDLAGVDVQTREEAADQIAADCDASDVIFWTEFGFGQLPYNEKVVDLASRFRESEPSFRLRNNEAEMRMLACALLDQVCHRQDDYGTLASYSTLVAHGNGWEASISDVIDSARTHVEQRGESVRTFAPAPVFKSIPTLLDANSRKIIDEQIAPQSYAHGSYVKTVIDQLAETTRQAIAGLQLSARQSRDHHLQTAAIMAEQTQLINWLLNASSVSLNLAWSSLDERTQAVFAGIELAESMSLLPEPPRALSLLNTHLAAALSDTKGPGRQKKLASHEAQWGDGNTTLARLMTAPIPSDASAMAIATLSLRRTLLSRVWRSLHE